MAEIADHPPFDVAVVTPDGPVFSGEAHMLIVPGAAGEIGVLARHALAADLVGEPGEHAYVGGQRGRPPQLVAHARKQLPEIP